MKKTIEKINKIKDNKVLKIIWNILYSLLVIITLLILLVVVLQRVSNNNIALGGFRIFNIVSESMVPKYQIGDILISKTTSANDIKVGDDVVYKGEQKSFSGKIVTHQVIQIEQEEGKIKFHTKGLANEEEDPIVDESQLYGKIIYKVQSLSLISKIINNLYSFYFLIFMPLVILIFIQIRKIINSSKENKLEENKKEKSENSDGKE